MVDLITNLCSKCCITVTKKPAKEEENWFKKKDYGKRPDYLEKVREEMIEEGEYVAMLEKQSKACMLLVVLVITKCLKQQQKLALR